MPTFESDPFPINVLNTGIGAVIGGPAFYTQITTGSGGGEQRNGKSRHARRQFRINTELLTSDDITALYAHFTARRGSTDSFPFTDIFDYTASGEPIVSGQLTKKYSFGGVDYYRPITLPKSGTVSFTGGGTLNYSTGVITGGSGGTWTGEFYIPARYDSDALDTIYNFPANASASCGIIEVWDSDIPSLSNAAPPARISSAFPLSFDLGIDVQRNWNTRIATTGFHEERDQEATAERNVYPNAVGHCGTEAHLDAVLSAFLVCRGARSGFLYADTPFRFGATGTPVGITSLTLVRTGYGSYSAACPLVQLNAA